MTEFNKETSLFCIFHNQNRYETQEGKFCSHIYSGLVHGNDDGFTLSLQDFDGRSRSIMTDIDEKHFNLAAMVPVARKSADALQKMVEKLNQLNKIKKWPFYFSRDMALMNKYEVSGIAARAPEGHIDPPMQTQKINQHQASGQHLLMRINCVRMALMNARLAGINISNIADINPLSNTGEEVRDYIHAAYDAMLTNRSGHEGYLFKDSFVAKKKGNDKGEANFVLGTDGLCIVRTNKNKDQRLGGFCDALARPIQGKSLFNWVSEGRKEKFKDVPIPVPPYLQRVLSLL